MLKLMTPGPTRVRENVRMARSLETTNPDLDLEFYEYYRETCELISDLLNTKNPAYILSGEGILGLEAACASLTEPGDRVLVIDNGVFGRGFADFVRIYGGEPVLYTTDYQEIIDAAALKEFLERDHDFKYATVVHCDTPSGRLNPVQDICPLLKSYGILTVVDAVASMFGEPVRVDDWQIDIVCGGSQKALSAPVGLTFVTVSEAAMKAMKERKTPIASFYANLTIFEHYYRDKWFPYTMPISDIYGLRRALENVKEEPQIYERHKQVAEYVRNALQAAGYQLYGNGYSNTVTAMVVPEGKDAKAILNGVAEEAGIMLAGSFDVFAGKLIRIGHMGENANMEDAKLTVEALLKVLSK
ncbi:MAG: alanine--glyoxylate aminotransferase family protein [Lachnospiraceae bacterium]|nr:alanine--glyoxylate aminotransferase family protein [Lachnospiraceae bacterium]